MATANPQIASLNPKALKIVSLVIKLLAAFPLLLGIGLLAGAGYSGSSRYTIVKKWPTVNAEVTQSQLANHLEDFTGSSGRRRPMTVYEAHIEFRYTIAGKEYTTPTGADYSSSNYAAMKQKVDIYAPGTHHDIRYNPANPNDIRYDAAYSFGYFLMPVILGGVGLVAFLIGVALYGVGRRIGRAKVRCPSCGEMVTGTQGSCPLCGAPLRNKCARP